MTKNEPKHYIECPNQLTHLKPSIKDTLISLMIIPYEGGLSVQRVPRRGSDRDGFLVSLNAVLL